MKSAISFGDRRTGWRTQGTATAPGRSLISLSMLASCTGADAGSADAGDFLEKEPQLGIMVTLMGFDGIHMVIWALMGFNGL